MSAPKVARVIWPRFQVSFRSKETPPRLVAVLSPTWELWAQMTIFGSLRWAWIRRREVVMCWSRAFHEAFEPAGSDTCLR